MKSEKSNELIRYLFPEIIVGEILISRFTGKKHPYYEEQQNGSTLEQNVASPSVTNVSNNSTFSQNQTSNEQANFINNNQNQVQPAVENDSVLYYEEVQEFFIDEVALNEAFTQLNKIIGMKNVKKFIAEIKDEIYFNIEREKMGMNVSKSSLHMVFTGNAGTGKTTVARIVANIMRILGTVSNGHLIEVSREDLVGMYQGHSAEKTKNVIQNALGGILFIDEAYSLNRGENDQFGHEAIDTLVKAIEDNRDNLIVILAGYTKEMETFMKANSGLKSRFPNQIEFEDYTAEELLEIAKVQIDSADMIIHEDTERALLEIFRSKQVNGRNDGGNGRLVRNVVEQAKRQQSARLTTQKSQTGSVDLVDMVILTKEDFGYVEERKFDLEFELSKIVGNEPLKSSIRELAAQVKIQKMKNEKGIVTKNDKGLHMIFSGNPGTGKTTIARIVGKLLKEMGVLKIGHIVETDRSGLVAGYVGQTATKTNEKIKDALGGILFIDEAYALAGEGQNDFGQEAIDTLVKGSEDYREDLIIILAGYKGDMEKLLNTNDGLRSRFPLRYEFEDYTLEELFKIFVLQMKSKALTIESIELRQPIEELLKPAIGNKVAGNGRYVRNVIEAIERAQNYRVAQLDNPTKKDLLTITLEDVQKVNIETFDNL